MDQLERELRSTFADDRLNLPLRPGASQLVHAGVRRRRRNRAIASLATVVVLAAGGAATASLVTRTGGSDRIVPPTGGGHPSGKPYLPRPSQTDITWDGAAVYDYHAPPAFPGAIADATVPWCRASELSLTQQFQDATGSWAGTVTTSNISASACALQGQPAIAMQTADGKNLLASRPEPFFVDAWIRLAPGHSASAAVTWFPEFCHEPGVARVTVALPHAGGSLSTAMTGSPRCDVDTVVPMAGHLDVGGFVASQDAPFTPLAGLQARLDRVPASALAGTALTYRLQLQSMRAASVSLDPCLPYRERLIDHATRVVLYEQDFVLNCGSPPVTITDPQSQHSTYFDLRVDIPVTAPVGDYEVVWQSVLKPVNAVSDTLVHVQSPPPPCRDGQLATTSGGQGGAAAGSYYDVVVFRNVSTVTCSLFGYPGVQLTGADGRGVKTDQQRAPATSHIVVLAPGAAASATISGADSGPNGGATPCKPFGGVLVIAPGQRQPTLVRHVGDRCYDVVTVWPVVGGTKGSLGG